ncbi:MAG TPA: DUF72 domain-containing protein [Pseudolabrys sp.]|nr:DUF72 domain-containing protein [Pseudolabrys sp.]
MTMKNSRIYAGIGGWTFEPWRGVFYPPKLPHAQELHYASRHLTTIEINGTFYRTQNPRTFAKWASEVPDGFVFAVKGVRYVTNRRVLAEAEKSISLFLESGVTELGDHLGPLLWQFQPTKKFDPDDFAKFLALLPHTYRGSMLRHVVEVRHDSFMTPEFVAVARKHSVAICYAEHSTYPEIADVTAEFVYARLQKGKDSVKTGYAPKALDDWAKRAETWAKGGAPKDLPLIDKKYKLAAKPRDVFVYFIHEGKVRAPAAAMELIERLK